MRSLYRRLKQPVPHADKYRQQDQHADKYQQETNGRKPQKPQTPKKEDENE